MRRRVPAATIVVALMSGSPTLMAGTWRADKTYQPEQSSWETGPGVEHMADPGDPSKTFPGWGYEATGTIDRAFVADFNGYDAWRDTGSNGYLRYRSNMAPATNDTDWSMNGTDMMVLEWHLWVDSNNGNGWPDIRMSNGYPLGVKYDPAKQAWVGSNSATLAFDMPMSPNAWHVVRVQYVPHATTFTFYVDSMSNFVSGQTSTTPADVPSIWWGRINSGYSGTFYTNYLVWGQGADQIGEMGSLVPEPATLSLLGTGLLLLWRRRALVGSR